MGAALGSAATAISLSLDDGAEVRAASSPVSATPSAGTTTSSPSPEASEPSQSPTPTPEPVLDGEYGIRSCELQLFTNGDFSTLVGSTEIENTGTVDAILTVEFSWLMGDGSQLRAPNKEVTLRPGRNRLVFFRETGVGIDTAGNFQDHPRYFDSDNCKTKATIAEA